MSNRDRRVIVADEKRVQLSIRVKRALYERMRMIAKSKGFLSVAEWARAAVISAVGEK